MTSSGEYDEAIHSIADLDGSSEGRAVGIGLDSSGLVEDLLQDGDLLTNLNAFAVELTQDSADLRRDRPDATRVRSRTRAEGHAASGEPPLEGLVRTLSSQIKVSTSRAHVFELDTSLTIPASTWGCLLYPLYTVRRGPYHNRIEGIVEHLGAGGFRRIAFVSTHWMIGHARFPKCLE